MCCSFFDGRRIPCLGRFVVGFGRLVLVGREGSKKDGRQRQGPSGINCATVQVDASSWSLVRTWKENRSVGLAFLCRREQMNASRKRETS